MMENNKRKGDLLIENIGELVTVAGSTRRGREAMRDIRVLSGPASVLIRDDKIVYAGPAADCPQVEPEVERIDAEGHCVLPGFVDSHTHLVFGGFREDEFQWRLAGESYMSIMEKGGGIAATTTATREASAEELTEAALLHLRSMLRMGVTTMEAKSGYGLDKETELRQLEVAKRLDEMQPIDVVSTYLGAHDIAPEYEGDPDGYIDFIIREMLPIVKERGLARNVDIFTEKNVFDLEQSRRLLSAAQDMGFATKMHADEIYPLGGAGLAADLGCLSADHLLKISDKDIDKMAKSQTVSTLLPLTAFSLMDDYAPARKMIDAGCAVALASDLNPGSCFSCSIPLMIALSTIYMHMSVEEAVTALTINAATALGLQDEIGSIEEGKAGDVVILRYPSYKFLSYHFGMNIVETTVKGGIPYHN
ncbi:imidazolonepropionase [uncultured Porphyromonas sp.]|uniref:imidazolonepropionase n=1 Tax=uncultured Porphyromonas sp. TaxID=159274 RepID=UPI00259A83E3|nr:imidazolonepropionase [uncultured Porphyromonas sp.]